MRIIKKIILILFPLVFIGCFVIYWVQPDYRLWQMERSLFLSRQDLPLMVVPLPLKENDQLLTKTGGEYFVFSGQNLTLFPGTYSYVLEFSAPCEGQNLGKMDIVRKRGKLGYGAKEIIVNKAGALQKESVTFAADSGFDYEFRLQSKGECTFTVKRVYLERVNLDYRAFSQMVWQKAQKII